VLFTHFSDPQGEAFQYMNDLIDAVQRSGIVASNGGNQIPTDQNQDGIILFAQHPSPISTKALTIAGINHEIEPPLQFSLHVFCVSLPVSFLVSAYRQEPYQQLRLTPLACVVRSLNKPFISKPLTHSIANEAVKPYLRYDASRFLH
jgi:hypothetical protein